MTKYIPPGFNRARVIEGMHKAMGFGEPTRAGDKATFFFPKYRTDLTDIPRDEDGVPFDPDADPQPTGRTSLQVPCAVEYFEKGDISETFGVIQSSRIKVTLLDPDYQKIKGFSYVVAGGDKYVYSKTQTPDALASLDVWTVWCLSEDDA